MGLSDVAGVFSRKFIVGFFIPVFFASFALTRLVDPRTLPAAYREAGDTTQVLVVGAVSVLIGLLLSGLHFSLLRCLEGYWLVRIWIPPTEAVANGPLRRSLQRASHWALAALHSARLGVGQACRRRWLARRAQLLRICEEPRASPQRTAAATELHRRFPASEATILPTEFGNVIRAFETHPRRRYGMDGIAVWPRISTMLSDGERSELEEATTDLAFWMNGLVVIAIAGPVLFIERIWHPPGGIAETALVELAVAAFTTLAVWWAYRQAIAAAIRWGDPVRAAFDVHRLQLYDALGVTRPTTHLADKAAGEAVARMLWFAEPIPDQLRARATADASAQVGRASAEAAEAAKPPGSAARNQTLKDHSETETEIEGAHSE
jgi:hypothetical protein